MVVIFGQQYNVGEKPTVMLYTYYINRHAGPPNNTENNVVLYKVKKFGIIYDNMAIESYNNRGLGQQENIGETLTTILYKYINRYAGTPNKTKTKYMISLDYSSICYIASRIGWVSMKENYKL